MAGPPSTRSEMVWKISVWVSWRDVFWRVIWVYNIFGTSKVEKKKMDYDLSIMAFVHGLVLERTRTSAERVKLEKKFFITPQFSWRGRPAILKNAKTAKAARQSGKTLLFGQGLMRKLAENGRGSWFPRRPFQGMGGSWSRCIHTVATVRSARAWTFLTPPCSLLAAVAYFTGEMSFVCTVFNRQHFEIFICELLLLFQNGVLYLTDTSMCPCHC